MQSSRTTEPVTQKSTKYSFAQEVEKGRVAFSKPSQVTARNSKQRQLARGSPSMVCYCYYERLQNEKNRICYGSECACVTMQRDCGDFDLSDTKYL